MKKYFLFLLLFSFIFCGGKSFAQNFSLEFDGDNDKVVVPNNPSLQLTNAVTVEAWIYANMWKPQQWAGTIVGMDGDVSGVAKGFVLRSGNNGTLSFTVTPGWQEITSAPVMLTQRWYHVAGVFDGSTMKIYIDGELQATDVKTTPMSASPLNLNIGECPGFAGRVFAGRIDEVRIWNVGRTQQEIIDNMTTSLNGNEAGLVAYYPANEGSGTTLGDVTANNFDGTLTNMDPATDWVGGFELLNDDIGAVQVSNPTTAPAWSSTERVKVLIRNFGFNDVSNFTVSYEYGGTVVTETVTSTLTASSTYEHTFNSFIDLTEVSEAEILVYTSLEGDNNTSNDMSVTTINKTTTIRLFDHVQHNFAAAGQVHYNTIYFPENLDNVEQILLYITLECPTSGCDPWDQPAKITLKKDSHTYEIGRYVTPYGIACGPWPIDITDFKSLLTGRCEFGSYIQVWGASGWLLTADIEFIIGNPDYQYSKISSIYEDDYVVYGDPNVSHDLPVMNFAIEDNTEAAQIRMVNSGHGQGNTNNAAEFFEVTHHFAINGATTFDHHLWKDDCDNNLCSPQNGTWLYDRAGWCPGQQVFPAWWNLEGNFTPSENLSIDYVLQDYVNQLNTGYNGGSHTEPHYRIHSFLVEESTTPYGNILSAGIEAITAPVNGNHNPTSTETVSVVIKNYGSEPISNFKVSYYVNMNGAVSNVVTETVTETIEAGETLNHTFSGTVDLSQAVVAKVIAFTTLAGDMFTSDDAAKVEVGSGVSVQNLETATDVFLFPNPANEFIYISIENNQPAIVTIFDLNGKNLKTENVNNGCQVNISELPAGVYYVKVKLENNSYVQKLVVE